MNKSQLINAVSKRTGIRVKNTKTVIEAALEIIREELSAGEKVQLTGFGTFEMHKVREHVGRNPMTSETMIVQETEHPFFRAAKDFRKG